MSCNRRKKNLAEIPFEQWSYKQSVLIKTNAKSHIPKRKNLGRNCRRKKNEETRNLGSHQRTAIQYFVIIA